MQWNWPSRSRRERRNTQAPALVAENAPIQSGTAEDEDTPTPTLAVKGEGVNAVVEISPELYAVAVPVGSSAHEQARRLQEERFAQVQAGVGKHDRPSSGYIETTDYAPERTIPIVVRRRFPDATFSASDPLVATARLELSGATMIEEVIQLRAGSPVARSLEEGRVAEIGGFATAPLLDRVTIIDAIDGILGVILSIAETSGFDKLLVFPRNGFMSLIRAEIPEMLPPYHFALCPDVEGWKERSERLQHFRSLGLRGLGKYPDIYAIGRAELREDVKHRRATREIRAAAPDAFAAHLTGAMIQTQRSLLTEARRLYPARATATTAARTHGELSLHMGSESDNSDAENTALHATPVASGTAGNPETGFLPFADPEATAAYLRAVVAEGGRAAELYKRMSLDLLDVRPGMRVLDVGCGEGIDLPRLAELVGPSGAVIGVDVNPDLVQKARARVADSKLSNVWVYQDDAEGLRFGANEFDRVRADRAMQHMMTPERALSEMYRILRPGGIVTVIEPDWPTIAVSPASGNGLDDDDALRLTLDWCRQHLKHGLIGRSLYRHFRSASPNAWADSDVRVLAFTFTRWHELDTVLWLSRAAEAAMAEHPDRRDELSRWLAAVEQADRDDLFFASVPLFFASASKAKSVRPPTVGGDLLAS